MSLTVPKFEPKPESGLGSKNGTFLNERQLLANESVQLASGDYITLGNEILKFEQ